MFAEDAKNGSIGGVGERMILNNSCYLANGLFSEDVCLSSSPNASLQIFENLAASKGCFDRAKDAKTPKLSNRFHRLATSRKYAVESVKQVLPKLTDVSDMLRQSD